LVLADLCERRTRAAPGLPPADRVVMEEAVEQHLLPRFAVRPTWAAVVGWKRPPFARGPFYCFGLIGVAWVLSLLLVLAALAFDGWGFLPALVPAAIAYLLIGFGVLAFGRFWAMPLMLRLPAAAAVGLIVLVALHPDWWKGVSLGWQLSGLLALLVGTSFG